MDSIMNDLIYQVLQSRTGNCKPINKLICYDKIVDLVSYVKPILKDEPIVLNLNAKLKIVGDIHGNIDDLLRIFEKSGYPPYTKYLFLGDYIDRGKFGIEVLILLLSLKAKYPNSIYLLRGNHETAIIPKMYGFFRECCSKYNVILYHEFTDLFQYLPIVAIVNEHIFCVHGGISQDLHSITDLSQKSKIEDIDEDKIISDLLWSDPSPTIHGFAPNTRGVGAFYGEDVLQKFLRENSLKILIRSHQMCQNGFNLPFKTEICYTIFSNCDYCGCNNSASILSVNENEIVVEEFYPLDTNEQNNRRVILPLWLIEEQVAASKYRVKDLDKIMIEESPDVPLDNENIEFQLIIQK
ncbi:Ser/Thr protein phosphatase [Histomonas meleagridis]|uniref:Ser/Thr protein phosphatase n=1 Tax=Histomonas meleagridis TaxID=135588 RepID=UPI003559B736|nr:Ser/Thr protein phosphatase [Histomonas meleagridis]KAH0797548.1 Ser/Thr protein phosphatase [Histomonas meleagridis]